MPENYDGKRTKEPANAGSPYVGDKSILDLGMEQWNPEANETDKGGRSEKSFSKSKGPACGSTNSADRHY